MSKLTISVELQGDRHANRLAKRLAEIESECTDRSANIYQKTDLIIRAIQDTVKGYELDTEKSIADFNTFVKVQTV